MQQLLALLACIATMAACAPCGYQSADVLVSNEDLAINTSGCAAAQVLRLSSLGANWERSSYVFSGVTVLPLVSVAAAAVDSVSILYEDIVADAAAMSGGTWQHIIRIDAASLTNVAVTLRNVTLTTSRDAPDVVFEGVVHLLGRGSLDSVRVVVDGCNFHLPLTGVFAAVRLRITGVLLRDVSFEMQCSTVVRWGDRGVEVSVFAVTTDRPDELLTASNVSAVVQHSAIRVDVCSPVRSTDGAAVCPNMDVLLLNIAPVVSGTLRGVRVFVASTTADVFMPSSGREQVESANTFVATVLLRQFSLPKGLRRGNVYNVSVVLRDSAFTALWSTSSTTVLVTSSDAGSISFLLENVSATHRCVGGNSSASRLSAMVRIYSQSCSDVNLICRYVVAHFGVLSESSDTSVDVGVILLDNATADTFALHVADTVLDLDVRNGTFGEGTTPGFGAGVIKLGVVRVSAIRNAVLHISNTTVTSITGGAFAATVTMGQMAVSTAVLLLYGTASNVALDILSCSLRATGMEFGSFRGTSTSGNIVCYGAIVGYNVTAILVVTGPDVGRTQCGLPGSLLATSHIVATVRNCTVINPYAHRVALDTSSVVLHTGALQSSAMHILDCSAPQSIFACSACHVVNSTIVSERSGTHNALRCVIGRCVMTSSVIRVDRGIFAALDAGSSEFLFRKVGSATTAWPTMPVSLATTNVSVSLSNVALTNVRFSSAGEIPWDSASLLVANCAVYNGQVATAVAAEAPNGFLSQVGATLRRRVSCGPDAATNTSTGSPPPPPPGSSSYATGVAAGGVLVGAVSSLLTTVNIGAVGSLQGVQFALRLRGRCRAGDDAASMAVGEAVPDNPTRISFGDGPLSYAGGSLVGNVVFIAAGGAVLAGVWHAARVLRARRSNCRSIRDASWTISSAAASLAEACTALYAAMLQPMVAAAMVLVHTDNAAVVFGGVVGVLLSVAPVAAAGVATLYKFPLVARPVVRAQGGIMHWLVHERSRWHALRTSSGRRAQWTLRYVRALIEPYRGGYAWMSLVELLAVVVQGVCVGLASVADSCSAVDAYLWAMLGVNVLVVAVLVATRPHSAMITTVQSVGMTAVAAVVLLLSALHEDSAADALSVVQSCLSLLLLFLPSAVRVATMRRSAPFPNSESGSTDATLFHLKGVARRGSGAAITQLQECGRGDMTTAEVLSILIMAVCTCADMKRNVD